jgi:peptidoglycan/LPS O-acetylase OafA/YrhL
MAQDAIMTVCLALMVILFALPISWWVWNRFMAPIMDKAVNRIKAITKKVSQRISGRKVTDG